MNLEDLMKSNNGVWDGAYAHVQNGAYRTRVAERIGDTIVLTKAGLSEFPGLVSGAALDPAEQSKNERHTAKRGLK